MDLTKEYMKNQRTLGYLHEYQHEKDMVLLSYAQEGDYPDYFQCTRVQADELINYWRITGDLVLELNFPKVEVHHPDVVSILSMEKTYIRKMHPPVDIG